MRDTKKITAYALINKKKIKEQELFKNLKKEVNTGANGTQGYIIKKGINKGKKNIMAITTIGLKSASINLAKDIDKAIEQEFRARALKAFADVKLTTPVDTGQARNSWYIGYTESYYNQKTPVSSNINILVPKDKPEKIIVTNGTTYIEFLNNGHSQQAPTKFIEAAFRRHFDTVSIEVTNG